MRSDTSRKMRKLIAAPGKTYGRCRGARRISVFLPSPSGGGVGGEGEVHISVTALQIASRPPPYPGKRRDSRTVRRGFPFRPDISPVLHHAPALRDCCAVRHLARPQVAVYDSRSREHSDPADADVETCAHQADGREEATISGARHRFAPFAACERNSEVCSATWALANFPLTLTPLPKGEGKNANRLPITGEKCKRPSSPSPKGRGEKCKRPHHHPLCQGRARVPSPFLSGRRRREDAHESG